jgi:hypothetical protein
MFVCEKCHQRDKRVLECKTDFKDHNLSGNTYNLGEECSICGKPTNDTRWCYAYKKLAKSNQKE